MTASEWRAGYQAALRRATPGKGRPFPTMPKTRPRPFRPTRSIVSNPFAPRECPPGAILALSATDATVAAHVQLYAQGDYRRVEDLLVAVVVSLADANRRHVDRECRRLAYSTRPTFLTLTDEERAALTHPRFADRGPSPFGDLFGVWQERKDYFAATWNNVAAPMPEPTVEGIREAMRKCPRPEPEKAIVTPSLEALRAVVPFAVQMDPSGRRTMDGIRVVVTKLADSPKLIPAADLRLYEPGVTSDYAGATATRGWGESRT